MSWAGRMEGNDISKESCSLLSILYTNSFSNSIFHKHVFYSYRENAIYFYNFQNIVSGNILTLLL